MSVSIAPVKVPSLHVQNFVESYRLTHSRIESVHNDCYGGYWAGGVFIQGEGVDSNVVDDEAWDEWIDHVKDTIEAIEADYGFDDDHPDWIPYCLLMNRRLTELASAMDGIVTKARRSELMELAAEYSATLAPLPVAA